MVAPQHLRLECRGVFGTKLSPHEEWSFSLSHDDVVDMDTDGEFVAAAGALSSAYATHIKPFMPANVVATEFRVSRIRGAGATELPGRVARRADGSLQQGVLETDFPGENGAINAPPQLALCVSLRTARTDATGKGRFYLPMPGFAPEVSDRRLSDTNRDYVLAGAAGFITALNGSLGFGGVTVASSKGYLSPVTGIRVGRAVDTIRSRRNRLVEDYAYQTV